MLIRAAKRFAILVPGLIIAYLSIFNIFPWLNDHLPIVAALFITYVLAAYVLIPATIRLIRIVRPPQHVPTYCVTPDGFASDPINIGIIGTRQELVSAMTGAGWYKTHPLTFRTAAKAVLSALYDWSYPEAPMSTLYLFGRRQDEAFQLPINGLKGGRHHVRFWATAYDNGHELQVHSMDWHTRHDSLADKRLLWVGAASRDIGITFIRHNAQLTHLVDPDTNQERDLIVRDLEARKRGKTIHSITLREPYKLLNIRGWTGHLHSDGKMKVVELNSTQTAD